jgi:hypothetical protein
MKQNLEIVRKFTSVTLFQLPFLVIVNFFLFSQNVIKCCSLSQEDVRGAGSSEANTQTTSSQSTPNVAPEREARIRKPSVAIIEDQKGLCVK